LLLPVQECHPMFVALAWQRKVAQPPVSADHAARFDGLLHKGHQTFCRGVRNTLHPNPPDARLILSRCNDDQRFVDRLPSANTFFQPAQIRFVHLDPAGESIASRTHHRAPQFMQPSPGRFVAPQAQNSLESHRAGSSLLAGDPPCRSKPKCQRLARILKNRPGRDRGLVTTIGALQQHTTQLPGLPSGTTWATETLRPPQTGTLGKRLPSKIALRIRPSLVGNPPWAAILHLVVT
jgi:hypothetical protein